MTLDTIIEKLMDKLVIGDISYETFKEGMNKVMNLAYAFRDAGKLRERRLRKYEDIYCMVKKYFEKEKK